jgi:hypothetical protein
VLFKKDIFTNNEQKEKILHTDVIVVVVATIAIVNKYNNRSDCVLDSVCVLCDLDIAVYL